MDVVYDLQESRGWLLAWGCVSIIAGMAAVAYAVIATLISVIFLAWLLILAGVLEGVYAIRHRERHHLILYLLEAILGLAIGALILWRPVSGAVVLTLVVATYFVISGIFRITGAVMLRAPHWGWLLVNGIVNLGLGILVWAGWPVTGLWVLGMFLGIHLLFSGWARVMLAISQRSHHLRPIAI